MRRRPPVLAIVLAVALLAAFGADYVTEAAVFDMGTLEQEVG